MPGLSVHFDLGELRGYTYKTGIVFAAFAPGWGLEVGRGGRYDDIGRVFGRSRPAVGFSTDLKGLLALGTGPAEDAAAARPVQAPWDSDPELGTLVERLRGEGRRVVYRLPGDFGERGSGAERRAGPGRRPVGAARLRCLMSRRPVRADVAAGAARVGRPFRASNLSPGNQV
jgi:ATP phosphoribosyltransferase regulatory subunit HisZ